MKLPQKIYVALRYGTDLVRGYMAVADKEETKYCQKAKDRADVCAGRSKKSMYVTNEAREGFRVIDYTTDGMLIEHPEGFSFYITPRNMYDLIRTCTIVNGEIDNKLYFSDTLTLISEVSEILSDTLSAEETLKKRKELLKSLKFNDTFFFGKEECVMVGRYHFLTTNSYGSEINSSSKLMYVFKNVSNGKYCVEVEPLPNIKKGSLQNNFFSETEEEVLKYATEHFKNLDRYGRPNFSYLALSKKPIKPAHLKSRFVKCELSELKITSQYPRISVIRDSNGELSYFNGFRYYEYSSYSYGSNYRTGVDYNSIDTKAKKYYQVKPLKKDGEIYVISERYNERESEMVSFSCPVSELDIEVGYVEIYL